MSQLQITKNTVKAAGLQNGKNIMTSVIHPILYT